MTTLMYLLWVEKMSRDDNTSRNSKGWEVLQDGWQQLKKLEEAFFKRHPEKRDEYFKYKKDQRRHWGNVERLLKHSFAVWLSKNYSLTFEQLVPFLKP